jgi:hypothetical protein
LGRESRRVCSKDVGKGRPFGAALRYCILCAIGNDATLRPYVATAVRGSTCCPAAAYFLSVLKRFLQSSMR